MFICFVLLIQEDVVPTAAPCKQKSFICKKEQEKSCHGYMIMWGLAKVSHGIQIFEMVAGASRDLASKTFSGEFSVSQNGLKNPNRVFKSVLD